MFRIFVTVAALATAAGAQVARIEVHPLSSTTLTDEQFLTGAREGQPVQLAAELRIPSAGTAKLPAVLLVHGSGGAGANVDAWARELNSMGIATLILDSFTGRGIANTLVDQSQLGRLSMIVDEYRALALLAKHPRIDPARIAVMGFSRGAVASLYASVKRFQRLQAMPEPGFVAHVALYPACNTRFIDDADVASVPIRVFQGAADDYVPPAACRAYVERLRAAGRDAQLTEYPGASHAYDAVQYRAPLKLEKAPTARRCVLEEDKPGRIVSAATRAAFTWKDACVEYGPTVAYQEEAAASTTRAVKDFFRTVFRLEAGAQK